jgi:hypothetical protein
VHDIPEEQKVCACGAPLSRIGEETNEKLKIIPPKLIVVRHIRPKYACRACQGVETKGGAVLHRNFTTFLVNNGPAPRSEVVKTDVGPVHVVRFAPNSFRDAKWSLKQWNVLGGLKVNGAGYGYFEYRIPWPQELAVRKVAGYFREQKHHRA